MKNNKRKHYCQDITFCSANCKRETCERNHCHIVDISIPHSFANFKNTPECPYAKMSETKKSKNTKAKQRKEKLYTLEVTKEQADCLVDFLECEFCCGIAKDPDFADNLYVKNIRKVYEKLNAIG